MKIIILTLTILASVEATAFSFKDRCSCSEYSKELVCSNMGYCSWIGNACVDLQCSTVSSSDCTAESTMYKCALNSGVCSSKSYKCSDITIKDNCKAHYGLDCIWQSNQCIPFKCTGIDLQNCDVQRCSNASGVCGPPQTVDCSKLTSIACAFGVYGGDGKICLLSDKDVCKSYNITPKNCADYSDLAIYCQILCSYDSTTGVCSSNSCSKFKTEIDCGAMIDYSAYTITPCYWTGTSCQDATDTDIKQYSLESCILNTMEHYAWDFDSQRCLQCTSFEKNPYLDATSADTTQDTTNTDTTNNNNSTGNNNTNNDTSTDNNNTKNNNSTNNNNSTDQNTINNNSTNNNTTNSTDNKNSTDTSGSTNGTSESTQGTSEGDNNTTLNPNVKHDFNVTVKIDDQILVFAILTILIF